jgi:uncharacterized protein YdeI (YjbR/CyaY-like superfamily)
MPALHFDARLESDQGACFIRVPPEVLAAPGQGKRVPVNLPINGYPYRTTDALRSAFEADAASAAAFEKLSYTRKKEFIQWVTGAKRVETQRRRMEQAMAMLRGRRGR